MSGRSAPWAVHLAIDRVTLTGYTASQQQRFLAALDSQLRAAVSQAGAGGPPTGGRRHIHHVDAGPLRAGAAPEEAAARVARGLLGVLQAQPPAGRRRS